jgi:hypothetical protein
MYEVVYLLICALAWLACACAYRVQIVVAALQLAWRSDLQVVTARCCMRYFPLSVVCSPRSCALVLHSGSASGTVNSVQPQGCAHMRGSTDCHSICTLLQCCLTRPAVHLYCISIKRSCHDATTSSKHSNTTPYYISHQYTKRPGGQRRCMLCVLAVSCA